MIKLIPLSMWAKRRYEIPPSSRTLRRWAQSGNIVPRPQKNGRAYFVPENARVIDTSNPDYLQDVAEALREPSPQ
jgi:hypothetical protein